LLSGSDNHTETGPKCLVLYVPKHECQEFVWVLAKILV
jgi:hypothetical protein